MGSNFLIPPAKRAFLLYASTRMPDQNPYVANGPSKRAKPQLQPLPVPPGHVSFRLLCHASRIGGVIGKSGNVIKQLQQSTGAKIRVEEALPESPDRVITVIAQNALTSKFRLETCGETPSGDDEDDNGKQPAETEEEVDISKAQEALIKVFERILEVAAESGEVGLGVGMGVVSCRLLAETSQAGSVIGKGGKVVEKIRKESGCKIRVLTEKLPACAAPNEEMVELEGDVFAVKKALVAVSRRLQDCQPTDRTRMVGSKPLETVFEENLHRPLEVVPQDRLCRPIDTVVRETLARPVDVVPRDALGRPIEVVLQNALRRPVEVLPQDSLRRHVDIVPHDALQRPFDMVSQDALRRPFDMVSQDALRRPIDMVSQDALHRPMEMVQLETLPQLHLDLLSHCDPVLHGKPSTSLSYASAVNSLSLESERVTIPDTKTLEQEVVFKILCLNDRVGGIIGKAGSIIRALQSETGTSVSVGATLADCDERLITITASENPESRYSPAQKAVVLVFSRSLEVAAEKGLDSFSSKGALINARLAVPSNQVGCLLGKGGAIISGMRKTTGAGIRIIGGDQLPKCVQETDQVVQISGELPNVKDAMYHVTGRLRDNLFSSMMNNAGKKSSSSVLTEVSPYGRLRDPAPILSCSSVGLSHSLSRHSTLSRGMDHLGLSHSLDRPPSPSSWTSQTVQGVNSRSITDVGRGLAALKGGLELGSGNRSAIVTNTTVEIRVPEDVIDSVYGENGSNLDRLRQISGAKVIVHEPRLGTTHRIIVISGTPDQTQAAQSLLQAFILTGQS